MLKIGKYTFKHGLVMAPLSGITNMLFRLYAKKLGAELVFSEMVSSNGLVRKQKKTFQYLKVAEEERPCAVQIFGSDPKTMAEAARIVEEAGADIVDINMGCPVKKVVKTGAGAMLLRDLSLAARIVEGVKKAVSIPVTVKTRLGWSREDMAFKEFVSNLEEIGVDAVWVHGRVARDFFGGEVRWDILTQIKNEAHIPIIPNGDIFTPDKVLELKKKGWKAVMIGRGFLRNPSIFIRARSFLEQEKEPILNKAFLMDAVIWAVNTSSRYLEEREIIKFLRSALLRSIKGFDGAKGFRKSLLQMESQDLDAILDLLKEATFSED